MPEASVRRDGTDSPGPLDVTTHWFEEPESERLTHNAHTSSISRLGSSIVSLIRLRNVTASRPSTSRWS
jgi:hypothetical protein